MFLQAGVYEIVSASGNHVFAAQCQQLSEAKAAFHKLAAWAAQSGYIRGIDLEVYIDMWRAQTDQGEWAHTADRRHG